MRTLFIVLFFFVVRIASANVVITEVMYDPEGADAGHEWIEVENRGSEPITVEDGKSGWKLFEDGTNHALTGVRGSMTLGAGSFAIIADNADNFLTSYPSWNGILLDSSFSLKNTGEAIVLKNSEGEEESSLAYDPTLGANGDGNSLQEKSGMWIAAAPTPGAPALGVGAANVPSETSSSNGSSEGSSSDAPSSIGAPTLSLRARDAVAIVGAPYIFEPRGGGGAEDAYYQWSFGDGATSATWGNQTVPHTYYYPGTYTVFLEASEPYLSIKLVVRAVLPAITITAQGDSARSSVTIENQGSDEVNLEKWQLLANGRTFILPKIILAPKQSVRLPSEVTRLATPEGMYVEPRFPNGTPVPLMKSSSPTRENVAVLSTQNTVSTPENGVPVPVLSSVQKVPPVPQITGGEDILIPTASQEALLLSGEGDNSWQWYVGVALIALFALLGFRFVRARQTTADEYEIIEDDDEM